MTPETSQSQENNLDSIATQRSITRTNTQAAGRWLSAIAVLTALSAIACGSASVASPGQEEAPAAQDNRREIVLDVSLYLLVDDAAPSASLSSHRDIEGLRRILDGMNEIWSQAGIRFEPRFIGPAPTPDRTLLGIMRGDVSAFFTADGGHAALQEPSLINGFYARQIGVVNGFAPSGTRTFFVTDNPSVHDRRVSSHEVGHILGLVHDLEDPGRLMFSGTNGMALTEDEVTVARHAATGILNGLP